ncbi:hypothetical protein B0H34DRAFT_107787 [Crassisporium funariophilum]|nr:hypothetical protein B0H34DRAFT_107787 [Crassisporium funariophilum]
MLMFGGKPSLFLLSRYPSLHLMPRLTRPGGLSTGDCNRRAQSVLVVGRTLQAGEGRAGMSEGGTDIPSRCSARSARVPAYVHSREFGRYRIYGSTYKTSTVPTMCKERWQSRTHSLSNQVWSVHGASRRTANGQLLMFGGKPSSTFSATSRTF